MENTERLITIYHTGFIVCAILFVIGILLALAFFFMFDIRNIFLLRTGRAKQQTISEMQERNLRTGKLSEGSPYTDSGELKRKEEKRRTGAFKSSKLKASKAGTAKTASAPPAGAAPGGPIAETAVLQSAGAAPETAVLQSEAAPAASAGKSAQVYNDPLQTAMLASSKRDEEPAQPKSSFKFTLTERTIIIHTTESI